MNKYSFSLKLLCGEIEVERLKRTGNFYLRAHYFAEHDYLALTPADLDKLIIALGKLTGASLNRELLMSKSTDSSITIAGHLLDTIKRIKREMPSILDGHRLCDGMVNGFLLAGIASVSDDDIYEFIDGSRLRFNPIWQEVLPPSSSLPDEF